MESNPMKTLFFLLVLMLPPSVVIAEEPKQEKPIEKDLVLSAKLKSADTIQPGEEIEISLLLTNSSKSATHRVIKPGDGSEAGWREPHIRFSVEYLEANGQLTDAPQTRYGRCGIFDPYWTKDFTDLAPSETLDLNHWLTPVNNFYEFQKPGKYQIRAHYDYRARSLLAKDKAQLPEPVRDIPVFQVTSAPVMLNVERPLDVRLKVKSELIVDQAIRLTDLFDVTLVNVSDRNIKVFSPTLDSDAHLSFEVRDNNALWQPAINQQADTYGIERIIKPKETLSLLGDDRFANGVDGNCTSSQPGTVKVRAVYRLSTLKPAPIVKSDWVEVKAKQKQQKSRVQGEDGANGE